MSATKSQRRTSYTSTSTPMMDGRDARHLRHHNAATNGHYVSTPRPVIGSHHHTVQQPAMDASPSSAFYAGAKFSEPPPASILPRPPISWVNRWPHHAGTVAKPQA